MSYPVKQEGYAMVQQQPPPQQRAGLMQQPTEPPEDPVRQRKQARLGRHIKRLRVAQSVLSALLSLTIAAFQAQVYAKYVQTQNAAGAWPPLPNVVPTILLLVVAVVALIFDACMLIAYS